MRCWPLKTLVAAFCLCSLALINWQTAGASTSVPPCSQPELQVTFSGIRAGTGNFNMFFLVRNVSSNTSVHTPPLSVGLLIRGLLLVLVTLTPLPRRPGRGVLLRVVGLDPRTPPRVVRLLSHCHSITVASTRRRHCRLFILEYAAIPVLWCHAEGRGVPLPGRRVLPGLKQMLALRKNHVFMFVPT